MITGTNPKTHGTVNNGIFDLTGEHLGAWHWFANTKVKTLWEAAKENGYCSASVAFPSSVGAKCDYIAPEYSWDESAHVNGVYSREAANSLEKIDAMLGELFHAAEEIAGEDLVICVVSDHGMLDNTHNISPNVLLHQAGLIDVAPTLAGIMGFELPDAEGRDILK